LVFIMSRACFWCHKFSPFGVRVVELQAGKVIGLSVELLDASPLVDQDG
jgi:hypothetical protein